MVGLLLLVSPFSKEDRPQSRIFIALIFFEILGGHGGGMNYRPILEPFLGIVVAAFCCGTIAVYSQPGRQQKGNSPSSPIFNDVTDTAGLKFPHYKGINS